MSLQIPPKFRGHFLTILMLALASYSPASADRVDERASLFSAFDAAFAACQDLALGSPLLDPQASPGQQATATKAWAAKVSKAQVLITTFEAASATISPDLVDHSRLYALGSALRKYCRSAMVPPQLKGDPETAIQQLRLQEAEIGRLAATLRYQGADSSSSEFETYESAPLGEDEQLGAPPLWRSGPLEPTDIMSPEEYQKRQENYARHLREQQQRERERNAERQRKLDQLNQRGAAPLEERPVVGLDPGKHLMPPTPAVPPEILAKWQSWHVQYQAAMKPLKAGLAGFLTQDRKTLSPSLRHICSKLIDTFEATQKAMPPPSPEPELDQQLRTTVNELVQMSYECAMGRAAQTSERYRAATVALAQVAKHLEPFDLKP